MAKAFYDPITTEQRHAVATLTAAGVRPHTIMARVGITAHALKHIMNAADWSLMLEGKRAALARLMGGAL